MFEPYYQDELITIYNGDCAEIAPTLGRFDLLLTDPPYGIGAGKKGTVSGRWRSKLKGSQGHYVAEPTAFKPTEWDDAPPSDELITQLREMADIAIIWGG